MNGFENFTPRARQVLANANHEAQRFNHPYVGTEHLLLGLCSVNDGVAADVLDELGVTLEAVRLEVERVIGHGDGETVVEGLLPYTPRTKKVFQLAHAEAGALHHNYIGTEHLLLAMLREGEGVAARVLESLGVSIEAAIKAVREELDIDDSGDMPGGSPDEVRDEDDAPSGPDGAAGDDGAPDPGDLPTRRGGPQSEEPRRPGATRNHRTPALDAFGRDLTKLARDGQMDPVIGRERERERVIQILCRRTKNNAALLGEAGVGKTAVVEGLAQAIAAGEVPERLRDKRIVSLDLALMVSGTKYRGQFEERIKGVMDEIKRLRNVILFIDEMHGIVGAGNAEGAMDAANIIKPALARGELQCIGATTLDEYRKYIEKDAALDRRFQTVRVEEPTVDETAEILRGIAPKYEAFHHVRYSQEALRAAAALTARYQPGRYLPDKAIDAIDETGARVRIRTVVRPPEIKTLETEIASASARKNEAIEKENFNDAAVFRDEELAKQKKLATLLEEWRKATEDSMPEITADDIAETLSRTTGVPIKKANDDEVARLLTLEEDLAKSVVGQDEAIATVSRALRRARADLKDPRRPIGSFIFLGPTGVGKTLFAKALAERVFGDPKALVQLDMSEYMEKHTASRLVGAPPGYVGFEEGGQLTERVRRRPYSVVLFDEIEKAAPDVMNILLQILEDGHLTDSQGRVVDFRNTVIILTSNLGTGAGRGLGALGFGGDAASDSARDREAQRERILSAAKKVFRPELLNRFDDIVVFRSLERADVVKILDVEMAAIRKRLEAKRIALELSPAAVDFVLDKGYDKTLGARPLRRAVERYIEDPVAEELLRGKFEPPCIVRAEPDAAGKALAFVSTPAPDNAVTERTDAAVSETTVETAPQP